MNVLINQYEILKEIVLYFIKIHLKLVMYYKMMLYFVIQEFLNVNRPVLLISLINYSLFFNHYIFKDFMILNQNLI